MPAAAPGTPAPHGLPGRVEVRVALEADYPALQQMLELYQYELSDLWPQPADDQARYGYDLDRHRQGRRFRAYVAFGGGQYLGFALVAPAAVTRAQGCWMEQFFVLKAHRRHGLGRTLAAQVLGRHPGPWEIGQMHGNRAAQAFWRRVIGELAPGGHVELQLSSGDWQGVVQQFDIPAPA